MCDLLSQMSFVLRLYFAKVGILEVSGMIQYPCIRQLQEFNIFVSLNVYFSL